ncbi:MAG TPA: ABC transporter ATP-binding protein [Firmicutes bacterium]|nr:ABC transporter ATP-binding protein [Bacillota bacterium]
MLEEDTILQLEHLSMRFGGLLAVNDLSFSVKRGAIFGLIGPNGAGKTTVFNCITQFYQSTRGTVHYRGSDGKTIMLNKIAVHNIIKHGITRTFQNVELVWELSVLDNLMVATTQFLKVDMVSQFLRLPNYQRKEKAMREKATQILEVLGLAPYKDLPAFGLPYGILKKIEMARALMNEPQLIILDEPAAGLNDKETEELAETIKLIRDRLHTTIFLVEHDMGLVMSICDTVCAISFGKMLGIGTPSEIQANPVVREAYLGAE